MAASPNCTPNAVQPPTQLGTKLSRFLHRVLTEYSRVLKSARNGPTEKRSPACRRRAGKATRRHGTQHACGFGALRRAACRRSCNYVHLTPGCHYGMHHAARGADGAGARMRLEATPMATTMPRTTAQQQPYLQEPRGTRLATRHVQHAMYNMRTRKACDVSGAHGASLECCPRPRVNGEVFVAAALQLH